MIRKLALVSAILAAAVVSTIAASPASAWPGPNSPILFPDLVISRADSYGFTVANIGRAGAGPFVVRVSAENGSTKYYRFTGLAAGTSLGIRYSLCSVIGLVVITADAHKQVLESNEGNNGAQFNLVGDPCF